MARGVHIELHYCPIPTRSCMRLRLQKGTYALTSIGLESRCSRCRETWPADTEFFHSQPGSATGLSSICKACRSEWRAERRNPPQIREAA